jgi:hypothetical protein
MKVHIIFDFPEISDVDGEDAYFTIDVLSDDLKEFGRDGEYEWYIEGVTGDIPN